MKRFEHLLAHKTLTDVVIRRSYFLRSSVVAVMAAGWFLISNHCALATAESAGLAAAHAHCHGCPAPAKAPTKNELVPCCKVLRAMVTEGFSVAKDASAFSLQEYLAGFVTFPEEMHRPQSFELDTGPPFSGSFAESVLQRSILAHAPPFSFS
jgi:hypothetical protein